MNSKLKVPLILSILILYASLRADVLSASVPSLLKTWSYGSPTADDLAVDFTGNVTIVGGMENATHVGDALLLKYDATGNLLIQRLWSGPGYQEATGVAEDSMGNAYLTGRTSSFGSGASGIFRIFLLKFDPSGRLLWQETYAGSGYDGWGATADSKGGVIISARGVLLKFNSSGSLEWQDAWTGTGGSDFGRVLEDASGDIYTASSTYLLKLNSTGGLLWAKTWSGMTGGNSPTDISLDSSGNIYLTAIGPSSDPTSIYLSKLSQNGTLIWQRRWQGSGAFSGWTMSSEGVAANASAIIYVTAIMMIILANPRGTTPVYQPLILEYNATGSLMGTLSPSGFYELGRPSTDSKGSLYLAGAGGVANPNFCVIPGSPTASSVSFDNASGEVTTPSYSMTSASGTVSTPAGNETAQGGVILMKFDSPISGSSVACKSPVVVFPSTLPIATLIGILVTLQARRRLNSSPSNRIGVETRPLK